MIPLITKVNSKNQDFGALVFCEALASPWVSLIGLTPQVIPIPKGAKYVRFAYDIGIANVYVSPDNITIPSGGSTELSRAEINPLQRYIGDLANEGITALNIVSSSDTTVHIYFYSE